jgi:hypothetical protein
MNNHLSSQTIKTQNKIMTFDVGNQSSGLGEAQKSGVQKNSKKYFWKLGIFC